MIRIVVSTFLICSLAACAVEPPVERELANSLLVQDVTVEVSAAQTMPVLLFERLGKSEAQVEADMARELRRELKQASQAGTIPVIVDFRIETMALYSAQTGISRALPYSQITSIAQIRDVRSGEILVKGKRVSGNDNVGKHTLGSSTSAMFSKGKLTRQAYDDVIEGFAVDVRRAIFDFDSLMSLVH